MFSIIYLNFVSQEHGCKISLIFKIIHVDYYKFITFFVRFKIISELNSVHVNVSKCYTDFSQRIDRVNQI